MSAATPQQLVEQNVSPAAAAAFKAYVRQMRDTADAAQLESSLAIQWAVAATLYGLGSREEQESRQRWRLAGDHRAEEATALEARRKEVQRALEADVGKE